VWKVVQYKGLSLDLIRDMALDDEMALAAVAAQSTLLSEASTSAPVHEQRCSVCGSSDDDAHMLRCFNPPLEHVPARARVCDECTVADTNASS
jgi:hypothetical protein